MDRNIGFDAGSHVEVIDRSSPHFRERGKVIEMPARDTETHDYVSDMLKVKLGDSVTELVFSQVRNVQKKFIDIEHIREDEVDLGNGIVRRANVGAFQPGDMIVIQEKMDGSNASISYNAEDDKLEVFSRTQLLDGIDGLRGFKQFIDLKFKPAELREASDYVIFGEWLCSHKCKYFTGTYSRWYVYDIWSKSKREYLLQEDVKRICAAYGLEYLAPLYAGPFVSWNHCRSFMSMNQHGSQQEGVVVKSQSKLADESIRFPKYLKIVNDAFKESTVKREKKQLSQEERDERAHAAALMKSVVTEARVTKTLMKLVDDGILPKELTPQHMGVIMKNVPKLVWEDVLKEEREVVKAAGENASRLCSAEVASIAKKIVLGK